MTFAEHLLQLRKQRGLKQTELAKIIGIGWRAYQTYERGEREPTLSTLIALADFYGLSLDELVCREREGRNCVSARRISAGPLQDRRGGYQPPGGFSWGASWAMRPPFSFWLRQKENAPRPV